MLGNVIAWPDLPERIPVHFGAGGEADRWEETSVFNWFLLPALMVALALLNYVLAWWLPRRPSLINLSDKKRFLALPAERQAPVIRGIQDFLYWLTAPVMLMFGLIQWTVFRTAHGISSTSFLLAELLFSLAVVPMIILFWIVRLQKEINHQVRLQKESIENLNPTGAV